MYDGDEASALFHLKKPDSSNLYFLNKFDLALKKDGQTNEINRAFYLNNFKRNPDEENKFQNAYYTTFTFKEAVNYVSGRPVLKTFENQKGEQYQSWEVLNSKKILDNGKMEEKHYHENYGFNLEKVLNNYSIKDLTNPEHKQRLFESLQRGNLQSVTFVGKDGKTEKLSISPEIPLEAIKVYDQNKTRIPTEVLVEKGYIGKELAEKIQQRINSITENNKHSHKPIQENHRNGQTQKVDNSEKVSDTIQKQSQKNLGKQPKKQKQKINK